MTASIPKAEIRIRKPSFESNSFSGNFHIERPAQIYLKNFTKDCECVVTRIFFRTLRLVEHIRS